MYIWESPERKGIKLTIYWENTNSGIVLKMKTFLGTNINSAQQCVQICVQKLKIIECKKGEQLEIIQTGGN